MVIRSDSTAANTMYVCHLNQMGVLILRLFTQLNLLVKYFNIKRILNSK